jgi:hypothetical protein
MVYRAVRTGANLVEVAIAGVFRDNGLRDGFACLGLGRLLLEFVDGLSLADFYILTMRENHAPFCGSSVAGRDLYPL